MPSDPSLVSHPSGTTSCLWAESESRQRLGCNREDTACDDTIALVLWDKALRRRHQDVVHCLAVERHGHGTEMRRPSPREAGLDNLIHPSQSRIYTAPRKRPAPGRR
jgi:hypothetical protein